MSKFLAMITGVAHNMLTDTPIRNAKAQDKDYRLSDHGGLTLLVKSSGSKLWQYRFRFNEKANIYSIGKYPEVSLAMARAEIDYANPLVQQDINSNSERKSLMYTRSSKSWLTPQSTRCCASKGF